MTVPLWPKFRAGGPEFRSGGSNFLKSGPLFSKNGLVPLKSLNMGLCGFITIYCSYKRSCISFYILLDRKNPLTAKSRETCRNYNPAKKGVKL